MSKTYFFSETFDDLFIYLFDFLLCKCIFRVLKKIVDSALFLPNIMRHFIRGDLLSSYHW
jgi:hypothetical protein